MAHLNTIRFPDGIALGVTYGPEFVTEIAAMVSGKEKRNSVRQRALCVGDCSHVPRLEEHYGELLKFFRGMNGRANTFRFKDYTDFEVALTEGVVEEIGDDGTSFQLCKKYFVATGFEEVRLIQAPIAAGLVLKDGATTLTYTTDYTVTATGIVATTAPRDAEDLTWSGEFDNVCRFDTDRMATAIDAARVFSWGGIPIREVRL